MKNILFIILLLAVSCGKIRIEPTRDFEAKVGPDFEKALSVCKDFYKEDLEKVDKCFDDYRRYFKIEFKIDMDTILDFCNSEYIENEELTRCINDLKDIINGIGM